VLDDATQMAIATQIQNDLAGCGVRVNIETLTGEDLYATGEGAELFGRNFDLALLAWPNVGRPEQTCQLYLGSAVPGPALEGFGYGWGGWNISGWQNSAYDLACRAFQANLPGTSAFVDYSYQVQNIFAIQTPAIPLYYGLDAMYARADLCGFEFTAQGYLWSAPYWQRCP
jgi:ABC-type transport system substrate-binding protein